MYTAAPKKTPHANVATIWEIMAKTTLVPDPVPLWPFERARPDLILHPGRIVGKPETEIGPVANFRVAHYYGPIFLITLLRAGGEKGYSLSVGFLFQEEGAPLPGLILAGRRRRAELL